jgi:hypothetical protein
MFAMKPSTMRARVVTLAARRTDNFWDLGNALLMLRDSSRFTGDFRRTVKKAELNLRKHITSAKSRNDYAHLPATESALRRSAGPRPRSSRGASTSKTSRSDSLWRRPRATPPENSQSS